MSSGAPAQAVARWVINELPRELGERDLADVPMTSAEAYRAGKTQLIGFFVGQTVRASQGKANPQVVQKLLAERLG